MLHIKNITAGYNGSQVLTDVNAVFSDGTISILMGPNGAGKTTFLKTIFYLTTIISGSILYGDEDITTLPPHERIVRGIAYVPQGRVNFGALTVRENLFLGARYGRAPERAEENFTRVLEQFPMLKNKLNLYAFALSGGEQQMLAIGRALMQSPALLLLDEPSLGLAPKLVKETFAFIREAKRAFSLSVIIVEHNIRSALEIADHGLVMVAGKIIADASVAELEGDKILEQVFTGKFE